MKPVTVHLIIPVFEVISVSQHDERYGIKRNEKKNVVTFEKRNFEALKSLLTLKMF